MTLNLKDLKTVLDQTGLPVAFSHFTESDNEPLPKPPFITFLITYSSNFYAENKTYKEIQNIQIELYTEKKEQETEEILESVLNEYEIPYATTESYIESELLYQKIYEVRLL